MTFPKFFVIATVIIFGFIGFLAVWKKSNQPKEKQAFELIQKPIELEIAPPIEIEPEPIIEEEKIDIEPNEKAPEIEEFEDLPEVDRMNEFFNKRGVKFPIIETITYKSRVPWLKGRPAWISDYASHYKTSRHFIARSLNGTAEYEKQNVSEGNTFNVFKLGKDIEFNLLVDLKTCRMWFYYKDLDIGEKVLVKTYKVAVGCPDAKTTSGLATPTGKYSLGEKIATYKPKIRSFYQGEKLEMVKIFGTRWIPFDEEIENCSEPPKGFGIHGLPLQQNASGEYIEDLSTLGKQISDGCIRLATKDMEELFAIIITRPTTIEIVNGIHN